jgi:hypothetical protein
MAPEINPRTIKLLKGARDNGLKILLTSSEDITNAIAAASQLSLTPRGNYLILETADDFGEEVRNALLMKRKFFSDEGDYYLCSRFMLVLSQEAFLGAAGRADVLNNLLIIIQLAEVVLCVGFNGDNKAKLVSLLQGEKCQGHCLAVLDSQDDLALQYTATISVGTSEAYGVNTAKRLEHTSAIFEHSRHFQELLYAIIAKCFRINYTIMVIEVGCRSIFIISCLDRRFLSSAMRVALLMGLQFWGITWALLEYKFPRNNFNQFRDWHLKHRLRNSLSYHLQECLGPAFWDGLATTMFVGLLYTLPTVRHYPIHIFNWLFLALSLRFINENRHKLPFFLANLFFVFFVATLTVFMDGPSRRIHLMYKEVLMEVLSLDYLALLLLYMVALLLNPLDLALTLWPSNPPLCRQLLYAHYEDRLDKKQLESLVHSVYREHSVNRTLADTFDLSRDPTA